MQVITIRNLRHNLVAHPIAGVLWALGFTAAGDWVHDNWRGRRDG